MMKQRIVRVCLERQCCSWKPGGLLRDVAMLLPKQGNVNQRCAHNVATGRIPAGHRAYRAGKLAACVCGFLQPGGLLRGLQRITSCACP